MINAENLSSTTQRFYFQAISGSKVVTNEDLKIVDHAIDYALTNKIEQNLITDYYLLWTLPKATGVEHLLEASKIQRLQEILKNSSFHSVLDFPIKRLKTHGQPIDKYVLKAEELALDYKKVAVCIGARHYIFNAGNFSHKEITTIFQYIIDNGTSKWLRLASMKLKDIPEGIIDVKGIEKIDLSRNPISQLPEAFFNLTDLKELKLEKTKIQSLPDEISRLHNLEYLNMSSSKLKTVSPKIGKLSKLRDLRFSESSLQDLPDEISQLDKLEYLLIGLTPLSKNCARVEELKKLGCPL